MNYYQYKAYFAALELASMQAEISKLAKRKDFKGLDLLMAEYDELVAEFNQYDKQAKARLLTIN